EAFRHGIINDRMNAFKPVLSNLPFPANGCQSISRIRSHAFIRVEEIAESSSISLLRSLMSVTVCFASPSALLQLMKLWSSVGTHSCIFGHFDADQALIKLLMSQYGPHL